MRTGSPKDEAFWMKPIGGIQNALTVFMDFRCEAIVDHGGSHHGDPRVAMVIVVPGEESLTKGAAVLDAAEAVWKRRPVFHRSKLTFREWIVVGCVGAAVGLGDAEIGQQ